MINSSVVITEYNGKIVSWLDSHSKMEAVSVSVPELDIVGNIYVGKVKQVVKNLQACFVEYLPGELGFLSFSDAKDIKLTEGMELPVQIVKEASKNKDAVCTCSLSLSGRYCVVEKGQGISISRKITGDRKGELRQLLTNVIDNCVVVRTNAFDADNDVIIEEVVRLNDQLKTIINKGNMRTWGNLLYRADKEYCRFLKGLPNNVYERIVTDISCVYDELNESFKCELYQDDYPLIKLYSLETKISELLSKQVWLKCGGNIVIEPTEAMTVIDVNTAKNMSKKDREENALKVNIEAAYEIARQIRLRNLSGIIIVDFINMCKGNEELLIKELQEALKADTVRCDFVEMTSLGLAQIVRKKIKPPIYEILKK